MPKAWLQDRKRDYYYQKAKAEHYRSRAAYKLFQVIKKYRFIEKGDVVIDLGAAPGGWIQAARKTVGNRGFILGIDLRLIDPFEQKYIRTVVCDIADEGIIQQIEEFLPRKPDVLISDAAPNISGIWEIDHARQIDLAQKALDISLQILKPSGNVFIKVFQGDMLDDFVKKIRRHFEKVTLVKPEASRARSSEIFILATGLK